MSKKLIIVGAGGFGREVAAMVHTFFRDEYRIEGFVDDGIPQGTPVNRWKVLGDTAWLSKTDQNYPVILAIGAPSVRRQVMDRLVQSDLRFPTLIHPSVQIHDPETVQIGRGSLICAGTIITTNVIVGNFNLINLACTIGHDVKTGDFCSIMPGVNISGGARLWDEVYIGTGAKLIKATTLNRSCTIGAGSVIHTDVPATATYAGIPGKELKHD